MRLYTIEIDTILLYREDRMEWGLFLNSNQPGSHIDSSTTTDLLHEVLSSQSDCPDKNRPENERAKAQRDLLSLSVITVLPKTHAEPLS